MNHPEIPGAGREFAGKPGEEPLNEDQIKKIARLQKLTLRKMSPEEHAKFTADQEERDKLVGNARAWAERGFVCMSDESAKRTWLNYSQEGKMRKAGDGWITEKEGVVNDLAMILSMSPEQVRQLMASVEIGEENPEE